MKIRWINFLVCSQIDSTYSEEVFNLFNNNSPLVWGQTLYTIINDKRIMITSPMRISKWFIYTAVSTKSRQKKSFKLIVRICIAFQAPILQRILPDSSNQVTIPLQRLQSVEICHQQQVVCSFCQSGQLERWTFWGILAICIWNYLYEWNYPLFPS